MQSMDASHVSLIHLELNAEGFDPFRCDKNISLGLSLVKYVFVCSLASSGERELLGGGGVCASVKGVVTRVKGRLLGCPDGWVIKH